MVLSTWYKFNCLVMMAKMMSWSSFLSSLSSSLASLYFVLTKREILVVGLGLLTVASHLTWLYLLYACRLGRKQLGKQVELVELILRTLQHSSLFLNLTGGKPKSWVNNKQYFREGYRWTTSLKVLFKRQSSLKTSTHPSLRHL